MNYIQFVSTIIILLITSYPLLMRYLRRPKLIIEPHCWGPEPNVRLLGFIVRNVGHNIARGVYGEAEFKAASGKRHGPHRICWNDSMKYRIDILPGPLNECWFYVARIERKNNTIMRYIGYSFQSSIAEECLEITVRLRWNYYGLRSLEKKFLLNLTTWSESKIDIING